MLNLKEYKKLKENNAVKFEKEDDNVIAIITIYNTYTGKKEIKEEGVDVIRYKNEKKMFKDQRDRAQDELDTVNLLLDDIK